MNKSKPLQILSIVIALGAIAAAVLYFKAKFKKAQ